MISRSSGSGPRQNIGYGALLGLLGIFTVWNAPTAAAQFSGVALVIMVLGDLIVCFVSVQRIRPTVDCKGVFASNEAIPIRILGISAAAVSANQVFVQLAAKNVSLANARSSSLDMTIGLDRGHHRAVGLRLLRQSTLGLFCLGRRYQCEVDVLVGPRRGQIDTDKKSGVEQTIGGVRVAQTADPRRLVHWASSARAQQLMVKELVPMTGLQASVLSVVVDLGWKKRSTDDDVAERARAYAEDALGKGRGVQLVTANGSQMADLAKSTRPRITAVGGALVSATPLEVSPNTGTEAALVTRVNSQREILSVLATATSGVGDVSHLHGEVIHVSEQGDQWSAS